MNPTDAAAYEPARTLDETINRRAQWTPANERVDPHALVLTATLESIERALYLTSVRHALALDPFDATPINAPTADESEAA